MKRLFTLMLVALPLLGLAQTQTQPRLSLGLAASLFYDWRGKYNYILNGNSTTTEVNDANRLGGMVSAVILVRLGGRYSDDNLVLNLPIYDVTKYSTLYNKESLIGFGYARKFEPVYVTVMVNYAQYERMNAQARQQQQFPNMLYPGLKVNAYIPYDTLEPYLDTQGKLLVNVGVVISFEELGKLFK